MQTWMRFIRAKKKVSVVQEFREIRGAIIGVRGTEQITTLFGEFSRNKLDFSMHDI